MTQTRRVAIASLLTSGTLALAQDNPPEVTPPRRDDEPRMPDGRSQTNAIAKQQHEDAVKDAKHMVDLADQIREEIEKAGTYVVPVSTLKKTEEIEKLARKIRARLRA